MLYLSTRGHPERRRFCEILLEGLAPDGGLYLPESYPLIDPAMLEDWRRVLRDQGYAELAFRILSPFMDDLEAQALRAMCQRASNLSLSPISQPPRPKRTPYAGLSL